MRLCECGHKEGEHMSVSPMSTAVICGASGCECRFYRPAIAVPVETLRAWAECGGNLVKTEIAALLKGESDERNVEDQERKRTIFGSYPRIRDGWRRDRSRAR